MNVTSIRQENRTEKIIEVWNKEQTIWAELYASLVSLWKLCLLSAGLPWQKRFYPPVMVEQAVLSYSVINTKEPEKQKYWYL